MPVNDSVREHQRAPDAERVVQVAMQREAAPEAEGARAQPAGGPPQVDAAQRRDQHRDADAPTISRPLYSRSVSDS